jgi:uncharacterized protein (DUF4415 family)
MEKKKTTGPEQWIDPDDAPELTKDMLNEAEIFQGDKFIRRGRGRPKSAASKEQISVRIDARILAKLREAGPGWQSQINILLGEALQLGEAQVTDPGDVIPESELSPAADDEMRKSRKPILVHDADADKAKVPDKS